MILGGIDPATETGLVVVDFSDNSSPSCLYRVTVDMSVRRQDYLVTCRNELKAFELASGVGVADVLWVIEDWPRHSSYWAAIKLARIQQAWIDAVATCRGSVVEMDVMRWQVPTGVNKFTDKKNGKGARKNAARTYASRLFGIPVDLLDHNQGDALCMVSVRATRERAKQGEFPWKS